MTSTEAVELAILCQQSGFLQEAIRNGTLDPAVVALLDEVPSALQLASPRLHWVAAPEFNLDGRSPIRHVRTRPHLTAP